MTFTYEYVEDEIAENINIANSISDVNNNVNN